MGFLSAGDLARRRDHRIIDVRPAPERFGPLGYLPGSRSVPLEDIVREPASLTRLYPIETPLALVCLSGRRSARLIPTVRQLGYRSALSLTGGVLAWRASGLPICGVSPPDPSSLPRLSSKASFYRTLLACFMAESAEHHLDRGDLDLSLAAQAVERVWREEIVMTSMSPSFEAVNNVLDRVAEIAWVHGFPADKMAENIDRMREAWARAPG